MNDTNETRLADRLHRELCALPDLKAPGTLAPRVLAALAARQSLAWYRKSWMNWPAGLRALFLVVSASLLGGMVFAGFQLPEFIELGGGFGNTLLEPINALKPYLAGVASLLNTVMLVIKAIPPQFLWWLAATMGLAYALCVGLGTLGYRLAFNRI